MLDTKDTLISILTEMYEESSHISGDETINFADVYNNPEEYDNDFYKNYILEQDKQERIIERHLNSKLSKKQKTAIRTECMFLAPKIPEKNE